MKKGTKHIVSLSGGKDSTAMLLRMLEEGMPVDIILFCDTGLEFEAMYRHIDKLERYIDHPITRLKSDKSFEYLFFDHMPRRKNPELEGRHGFSWAGPHNRWCTAMLKTRIIDRYLREISKEYDIVQYIGIAADEPQRIHEFRYPLVEWGMTEADCLIYCKEHGFDWDGLYDIFHRCPAGAALCSPLRNCESCAAISRNCGNSCDIWIGIPGRTFLKNYSVEQLEVRFAFEEERTAKGLPIKGKDFFSELKEKLKEVS